MADSDFQNLVILRGRVGQAPALRYLPSGDPVCNFNLATKKGANVEWHRIVFYKDEAKAAHENFGSGDLVYVQGEIRSRDMSSQADKAAGNKPRRVTEIIGHVHGLIRKNKGGASGDAENETPPPAETDGDDQSTLPKYV